MKKVHRKIKIKKAALFVFRRDIGENLLVDLHEDIFDNLTDLRILWVVWKMFLVKMKLISFFLFGKISFCLIFILFFRSLRFNSIRQIKRDVFKRTTRLTHLKVERSSQLSLSTFFLFTCTDLVSYILNKVCILYIM